MRRLAVVAVALAAVAPASALAQSKTGFAYGRSGGNIMPFTLTVATSGAVTATGAAPAHRNRLTKAQLATLNRVAFDVQFTTLPASQACAGTLPDIAWQSIRVGARTVRVHGSCSARFNRLWTALSKATAAP